MRTNRIVWRRCHPLWIAMAAVGLALLAPRVARAELTVKDLTGNAINGVGPFYQDVEDAIRRFYLKDYSTALMHLERAVKTVPRLAPPEVMMAQLYADAGEATATVGMLERAILRAPEDPEAYIMLAERAINESRVTEANLLFARADKAIEGYAINPKRKLSLQTRLLNGAASSEQIKGNNKEAQAKLQALVKLDPQNARAQERLGALLMFTGDQKGAYAAFQAAAEADPKTQTAEIAMALLSPDKTAGDKWLGVATKKGPEDVRTQIGAASYLLKTNQPDKAKSFAEAALKLDPDNLDANLTMGIVARYLGDFPLAQKHLEKAHLLSPTNASICNHLALTLLELSGEAERERALQYATMNVRQNSNDMDAMATYAWIAHRLNRRTDSDRAFGVLANMAASGGNQISADTAYYLANFARNQGRTAEAVRLLRDAVNSNQPFVARKAAQTMFAQLSKGRPGAKGEEPAAKTGAGKAGPGKAGAGKADSATKGEAKADAPKTDAGKADAKSGADKADSPK